MHRKTKIIATLGPATASAEVLDAMIRAGTGIFRLNMSHAPAAWCREISTRVRERAALQNVDVALLMDMRGPTIRTGDVAEAYELKPGDTVEFTLNDAPGTLAITTSVNYPGLYLDLKPGNTILVDNGLLHMKVVSCSAERVIATAINAGTMGSRRHINLPGIRVNLPPLTDKDYEDICLASAIGCDWVAMSFVRDASHIHLLRRELQAQGSRARIMAKIEDQQAVAHLEEITEASDAVMVARGDLGIEVHLEELPVIQRRIVSRCVHRGVPVVVATHMLESMITNPVPTRAEVTDVANAVFEEADAIMLSGETSTGAWPVACVEIMDRIARRVEEADQIPSPARHMPLQNDKQRIVKAAVDLADSIPGAALVVFTLRGVLARYTAASRPQKAHTFAFCPTAEISRPLILHRGIMPFIMDFDSTNRRESISKATAFLRDRKLVASGTTLVFISDVLDSSSAMDSIVVQKA